MLGHAVPEVEGPVRSGCAECPVHGVEGYRVHRVHLRYVVLCWVAVAFEGEVGTGRGLVSSVWLGEGATLPGFFVVYILDGASAFDTANGEARCVCEAADDPSLPFQRAL